VRDELLDWGFSPKTVRSIPNGVDTEMFKRRTPVRTDGPVRFLLIGRRHPQKGVDITLQACRQLLDRGYKDRFEVNLYGLDYPEFDYTAMAGGLNVDSHVTFLPYTDAIIPVMEDAACLLLPSRCEGLSNVLLEAMSMELPAIATAIGGTVDVVTDETNGLLIPPESPSALAESMARIIDQRDRAAALGQAARETVTAHFSLEQVAAQYATLYDELSRR
jgi:type III pantothenate kinase